MGASSLLTKFRILYYSARFASLPAAQWQIERAQKTVLNEFYPRVDLQAADLQEQLEEWPFYDNWQRIHGSLGKAPIERCNELFAKTALLSEGTATFDEARELEIWRNRAIKGAGNPLK